MRRLLPAAAAALALALALGGCGVGAGKPAGGAKVTVTRDFGSSQLGLEEATGVPKGETVMRLLTRRFDVQTRYGGNFVQSIDGLAGEDGTGRRTDWFFYVNGIESEEGASAFELSPGDRVWWDHHEWSAAMRVPAVVGSFPEPFKSGYQGRLRPVRLDCASDALRECDEVAKRLIKAGVRAVSKAAIGAPSGIEILRVIVGRWTDVRRDPTVQRIERGPGETGVFARFDRAGTALELLDERGKVVRALTGGAGLVAATRFEAQQPTWVVTGVDAAGVAAAAAAMDESILTDRFAVAIEDGRSVPLPVRPPQDAP